MHEHLSFLKIVFKNADIFLKERVCYGTYLTNQRPRKTKLFTVLILGKALILSWPKIGYELDNLKSCLLSAPISK